MECVFKNKTCNIFNISNPIPPHTIVLLLLLLVLLHIPHVFLLFVHFMSDSLHYDLVFSLSISILSIINR